MAGISPSDPTPAGARRRDSLTEEALLYLREALAGLRFGDVRVTVQDGVVVQIERIERRRPQRARSNP